MLFKLAQNGDDARVALSAVAAVRASNVRMGKLQPFPDRLASLFVKVCVVWGGGGAGSVCMYVTVCVSATGGRGGD